MSIFCRHAKDLQQTVNKYTCGIIFQDAFGSLKWDIKSNKVVIPIHVSDLKLKDIFNPHFYIYSLSSRKTGELLLHTIVFMHGCSC